MFVNEKVPTEQEYEIYGKKLNIVFDCDSSPMAWKHYQKYYPNNFFGYDLENPHFYEFLQNNVYVDYPLSENNRLYALKTSELKTNSLGHKEMAPCEHFGGETDFNFNSKKYYIFSEIIRRDFIEEKIIEKKYNELCNQLERCKNNHHRLVNFSLMFVMGNLQGFKSNGLYGDNLDRLDSFLYFLDDYFKKKFDIEEFEKRRKNEYSYLPNSFPLVYKKLIFNKTSKDPNSKNNADYLKEYLNIFVNIYDYCQQIYFIYDTKLVDDLITNGEKEILFATNAQIPDNQKGKYTSIEEYMNLAERFWRAKEFYFISKDNEELLNDITSGGRALTKDQLKNIFCDYGSCSESDLDGILNIYLSNGFLTKAPNDVYVK